MEYVPQSAPNRSVISRNNWNGVALFVTSSPSSRRGFPTFLRLLSSPRSVSLETYEVITLLRHYPAPYAGEFLAKLDNGIMYGHKALPRDDWYDIHPVGHTQLTERKHISISALISTLSFGWRLPADKVKINNNIGLSLSRLSNTALYWISQSTDL